MIKDSFNKHIDNMILDEFGLKQNIEYNYQSILKSLNNSLTFEIINKVWSSNSFDDNKKRFNYTSLGIKKIVKKKIELI